MRRDVQGSGGQKRKGEGRRVGSGNADMHDKIASVCSCGLPLSVCLRVIDKESMYLTYCQIPLPFLWVEKLSFAFMVLCGSPTGTYDKK